MFFQEFKKGAQKWIQSWEHLPRIWHCTQWPLFFTFKTPLSSEVCPPLICHPQKVIIFRTNGRTDERTDGRNIWFWLADGRKERFAQKLFSPLESGGVRTGTFVWKTFKNSNKNEDTKCKTLKLDTPCTAGARRRWDYANLPLTTTPNLLDSSTFLSTDAIHVRNMFFQEFKKGAQKWIQNWEICQW